jgi:hypothetical protein
MERIIGEAKEVKEKLNGYLAVYVTSCSSDP